VVPGSILKELRLFGRVFTRYDKKNLMYNLFNEKKKKNHHKFKLDVDGSSCSNPGRLGFGGLLRNEAGSWLMSFSGFAGVGTNLFARTVSYQTWSSTILGPGLY
jgi:hypothetical protein